MTRERAAATRLQLQMARQAALRGAFASARLALRQLDAGDFAAGIDLTGPPLAVLRDHLSSDAQIRDAVHVLIGLRPAGGH
jgi:hypothetical protein